MTTQKPLTSAPPPGWQIVDQKKLSKQFSFKNFQEALDFTNRVGALSEKADHHPDIYLSWGKVKIELWTHTTGGLTQKDFALAQQIESSLT